MDKLIKLSAISKLAEMGKPKGEPMAEEGEHGPMTHKCVCACCEAPCETCAEAEGETPEGDSEEYASEEDAD